MIAAAVRAWRTRRHAAETVCRLCLSVRDVHLGLPDFPLFPLAALLSPVFFRIRYLAWAWLSAGAEKWDWTMRQPSFSRSRTDVNRPVKD